MKKLLVILAMFSCLTAFADEFMITPSLTQKQFKDVIADIGLAVTPTPNSPAEPLKLLGFDVAVESQITTIKNDSPRWTNSWDSVDVDGALWANRIHVQKGLPGGFDIGASYTKGANLDFAALTLEGKYAILEGSTVTPAVSAKLAYTKVFGLEDIGLSTVLAGLYVSKGILMLTPYAGVENIYTMASNDSDQLLDDENANSYRGIVGVQICPFPFFVINVEAATGAYVNQYGLKAAVRF